MPGDRIEQFANTVNSKPTKSYGALNSVHRGQTAATQASKSRCDASTQTYPVYRRLYRDACTQTDFQDYSISNNPSLIPKSTNSQYQKNSISSSKSKSNAKSKTKSKSKTHFKKTETKSYKISSLIIPPENLLHCKFHVDGQPVTLLVDTGAAISVISKNKIGNNIINSSNKVSIIGVSNSDSTIQTHGTSDLSLDQFPKHQFHIADLNISSDGILGNDFMSKFNVNIYVQSKTMRVRDRTYKLFLLNEATEDSNHDSQSVSQRSETVICCHTNDICNGTAIVEKQILSEDLTIPNAIVHVKNNKFLITCVNSSNQDKHIPTPLVHVSSFDETLESISYPVNSVNTSQNVSSSLDKVSQLIRRDHLNKEESESLDKVINEFTDIFYTDGDQLTFTNHTKHSIPTTSETPINTKTYRFPFIHQQEVKSQINKMLDQNIVRPSSSPWSSPIWVVPKKIRCLW